ncbi:MAG: translation initiation factor IF-2 N-terminal domain-containing protein, partial [Leptospirales bacterium]|nr:translation initiation factor IF-2 N-terminal domain-containing protein [Leptospirales bacterium]
MAKVRVYELARDLAMDSRKLVELLTTAGIDVKNYMSVLDDEDVVKAKRMILDDIPEAIEEKRITNKLIRRRKINSEFNELPKLETETYDINIEEEAGSTANVDIGDDKENIRQGEPHEGKNKEMISVPDLDQVGFSYQADKKERQHNIKRSGPAGNIAVAYNNMSKEASNAVKIVQPSHIIKTGQEKLAGHNINYHTDITENKQDRLIGSTELIGTKEKTEKFPIVSKEKEEKATQGITFRQKKKKIWDTAAKVVSRPEPIIDINVTNIGVNQVVPDISKVESENKGRIRRDILDDDRWGKKGKVVRKRRNLDLDWDPISEIDDDDVRVPFLGRKKKEVYERSDLYHSQPYKSRSKNKGKEVKKRTEVTIP